MQCTGTAYDPAMKTLLCTLHTLETLQKAYVHWIRSDWTDITMQSLLPYAQVMEAAAHVRDQILVPLRKKLAGFSP